MSFTYQDVPVIFWKQEVADFVRCDQLKPAGLMNFQSAKLFTKGDGQANQTRSSIVTESFKQQRVQIEYVMIPEEH